jgi:hypothetical protein
MLCPYCKKGGIKFVDQDVTIESFCVFVDLIFKCENCGKESILHFEDGEWQDMDYTPIEGADDD